MTTLSQSDFINRWRKAWRLSQFKAQLVLTLIVLLLLAIFITPFFNYIQSRNGAEINDLILERIPPLDTSLFIFILIYGALITGLIYLSQHPFILIKALQAYCMLVMMRMGTILLLPLEPDRLMIPLIDPFIDRFFYNNRMITKDLFFSGHVSTLFLLVLSVSKPWLKFIFLIITILVASLLLMQHVHYSVDIVVAPLFSWVCLKLVGYNIGGVKGSD